MGRPKKSKAQKIRELLNNGKTVAEIIKSTGATPSYVYAIKTKMKTAKAESLPPQYPIAGTWVEVTSDPQPAPQPSPSLFERIINRIAFWR